MVHATAKNRTPPLSLIEPEPVVSGWHGIAQAHDQQVAAGGASSSYAVVLITLPSEELSAIVEATVWRKLLSVGELPALPSAPSRF